MTLDQTVIENMKYVKDFTGKKQEKSISNILKTKNTIIRCITEHIYPKAM